MSALGLARFAILSGVLMALLGTWQRDRLPEPTALDAALTVDPVQTPVALSPFGTDVGGVHYTVRPLFAYELWGLVVSQHDSRAWWDIIHNEWQDYLNAVDLCVIYGENARSGAYRGLRYSSGQFECFARTDSSAAWQAFDPRALSNNHLLTDDAGIAKTLRSVRVGDQVRFKGWLVEYSHPMNGQTWFRGTSITRDDTGDGACETVFVREVEVIRHGGGVWPWVMRAGLVILALGLIAWLVLPPTLSE